MGRQAEVISSGESFEITATDRTYQGARVSAFKVSGDVAPGAAGQVQMAAAPSIAGKVQATSTGLLTAVITGTASPSSIAITGVSIGDKVVSVTDLSTPADDSTDFETTISVAGHIARTAGSAADKYLVLISKQS